MDTRALERYIELRKQILAIESELEALKPTVAAHLSAQGRVARLNGYELMLRAYTAWDYSPEVASMQMALNEAKRRERQNGSASVRERRDILVLKSSRPEGLVVRETPDSAYEWESDDTPASGA
jgi:hypothetical protein